MQDIHGGNVWEASRETGIPAERLLDFSANINPLGPPDCVRAAVLRSLEHVVHYPDPACREFCRAAAGAEQVPEEWILPGNGAADCLFALVRALSVRRAAVVAPAFSEYEAACRAAGCACDSIPLSADTGFVPEESLLERIPEGTELLFVCTPNNPTGAVADRSLIESLLGWAERADARLLVDESFLDFREDAPERTAVPLCRLSMRLIVLKSLTKLYAVPGIRLGYAVCSDRALLQLAREGMPPWNVNGFAAEIGPLLFEQREYVEQTRRQTRKEADWMLQQLRALPDLTAFVPGANFILFCLGSPGRIWPSDLRAELYREGILVRPCGGFAGLDSRYYRICVSSHERNERLLAALREIAGRQ